MSKRELISKHRAAILALAAKHGAEDLRLFGSVARGDDSPESDVDLLASFPDTSGWEALHQHVDLEEELARLLECKVHVVREHRFMRPRVRASIEPDLVPL